MGDEVIEQAMFLSKTSLTPDRSIVEGNAFTGDASGTG